jgi:hypothetical protein
MIDQSSTSDLSALWAVSVSMVTAAVVQGLKAVSDHIAKLPDWVKAVIAFMVSAMTTRLAVITGVPIPADLAGASGVIVNWAAAMGLHSLVKKVLTPPRKSSEGAK